MPRIQDRIELVTGRLQHHPSRWKRLLATAAGVLALGASFFLGLVILVIAIGVAAAVATFIAVRIWWLRKSLRGQKEPQADTYSTQQDSSGRIIEGESRDISDQ